MKKLYGYVIDVVLFIDGKFNWDWIVIYCVVVVMVCVVQQLGKFDQLCWGGVWDKWMFEYVDGYIDVVVIVVVECVYCICYFGFDFVDGLYYQFYVKG